MKWKSTKGIRITVAVLAGILLLAAVLFWLSPVRKEKIATSSLEIPEGWEIVSQKDGVTHIRMKEGTDAYHWVVIHDQEDFYMDVAFPGNSGRNSMKPDQNGEFHVAAYVGYNQVKENDHDSLLDPSEKEPYRLIFFQRGEGVERGEEVELYQFDTETITTQKNVVYDGARVGLTEAFIYSIPESHFADSSGFMRLGVRHMLTVDGELSLPDYPVEIDVDYTISDGMIHFVSQYEAVNEDPDHPFLSLMGGLLAPIIGVLHIGLFAFAIVWTAWCTKKRWNPFLVIIPCLAGAVCSWLVMLYYNSLPAHGMFPGFAYFNEVLFAFFCILAYIGLAVVLLIVRVVAVRVQARREMKRAQENSQPKE